MAWQKTPTKADKLLGKKVEELRRKREVTLPQLGRMVNEPYQQVERYEKGQRLPVDKLQEIVEALDFFIPKKIIRKMVFVRKLEKETGIEQDELIDIYTEAFEEDLSLEDDDE